MERRNSGNKGRDVRAGVEAWFHPRGADLPPDSPSRPDDSSHEAGRAKSPGHLRPGSRRVGSMGAARTRSVGCDEWQGTRRAPISVAPKYARINPDETALLLSQALLAVSSVGPSSRCD